MNRTLWGVIAACTVGCAQHPAPTDQIASSIAAVRGAEEAGALDVPEAALYVKLAQEQIHQAQELMKDEQNERAEDKSMRAREDAELAVAIARRDAAQKKLSQFEESRGSGGESLHAQPGMGETP